MKYGVKCFTLPGQEYAIEQVLNNQDYVVVEELKTACPKDGIILYLIKYEDHSEEDR